MSKLKLDPRVRQQFVDAGKRGGEKVRDTKPPGYYSEIATKRWKDKIKKEGIDSVKQQMSAMGKKSRKLAQKKKDEAERKRKIVGIGGQITRFLGGMKTDT